jgi:hypothetical protein
MFDIVSKFNGRPTPCNKKSLYEILQSPVVARICNVISKTVKEKIEPLDRRIAAATEPAESAELEKEAKALWEDVARLKKRLPAFCFQAHFKDGKRSNKNAEPSGLCMFDIDDLDDPKSEYNESQAKLKSLGVVMAHVTPSTHGLRYVFKRPDGMTIAESQQWFAEQLGISSFDSCTKDLARISFAVPQSYVLYLDETALLTSTISKESNSEDTVKTAEPVEKAESIEVVEEFKGIPFSLIIERLLLMQGIDGEPADGERNTTLYNMVRQLRYICDFSMSRLMQVVPRWGMSEDEVKQTVQSALSTVRRTSMPPHLEKTLRFLMAQQTDVTQADKLGTNDDTISCSCRSMHKKIVPQAVPGKLPRLFELFTKSYPEEYHAVLLMASLPILGTLATRARAKYFDGMQHSLSFLTCIVAPQASGKSCTRTLVDMLLAGLQRQDNEERLKERKWMEEKKARKNSEKQPEDPRAKIRIVPATVSNAMLFKRLDCADGEHLFTYAEEIDTLSKGRKSGAWSQKDDIMRQAFDNSICGQDYMSDNSWSAMVKVYYNTLTCGTPIAVHRYYNDVEGGLVSRVCFSQLPDMLGAQMPIFGSLTKDEETEVAMWVNRLSEIGKELITPDKSSPETEERYDNVEYDIPRVKQAIWDWLEARRLEYLETQENPALDIFRRRSAVIGFRAGLLAVLLCDNKETDEAVEMATWVASYALSQQLDLFGEDMNRLMLDGESATSGASNSSCYQSLLSLLPDEFTIQELVKLRMQAGYKSPVKQVVWRWKQNGVIESAGDNKFRKLKISKSERPPR